jgi:hypothetical protein
MVAPARASSFRKLWTRFILHALALWVSRTKNLPRPLDGSLKDRIHVDVFEFAQSPVKYESQLALTIFPHRLHIATVIEIINHISVLLAKDILRQDHLPSVNEPQPYDIFHDPVH